MRKEVLIYMAYAFIGMVLIVMIFFGEGRITSLAIFNGDVSNDQVQSQVEKTVIEEEVVLFKNNEGSYVSEVFDSGSESIIRNVELNEEIGSLGRLLYGFGENGELLVSSDEGLTWEFVNDPAKIEKMKSAVRKSDLIEHYSKEAAIEIRLCSSEECNDGEFVEIDDVENLEGRYFQYRARVENSDVLDTPDSISAKITYEASLDGEIYSEENTNGGIVNNE